MENHQYTIVGNFSVEIGSFIYSTMLLSEDNKLCKKILIQKVKKLFLNLSIFLVNI